MSSINSTATPRKLILTVFSAVVCLHVLTAMVLAMVKTPDPAAEPLTVTPPIKIQLVAAPAQTAGTKSRTAEHIENEAIENLNSEPKSEVESKPKTEVKSMSEAEPVKAEPELQVEPKPEAEIEAEPEPQTVEPKATEAKPIESQPTEPEVVIEPKVEPEPVIKSGVNTTTQTTIKKAESSTTSTSTVAETKPTYDGGYTQHSTIPTAPTTNSIANSESRRVKSQGEVNKKEINSRPMTPPTTNNKPVNFNESDASWAVAPRLSFPSRAERGTSSGDTFTVLLTLSVNKQGGIDSVSLAQSSGNTALDKEALRQVKTGRFVPFTKDGAAVAGSVTLPIAYKVP